MRTPHLLSRFALVAVLLGCGNSTDLDPGGPVQITIQQSLTSQTTSAGTFQMSGAFTDNGSTTEELTFGGPLDRPPVPVTFRRTLTGREGTLVVSGAASLNFSSPTAASLTGTWQVQSATGRYASLAASGALTGTADFGAAPPTAAISYTGTMSPR